MKSIDVSRDYATGTALLAQPYEWSAIVDALRVAADASDQDARDCPYSEMVPAFRESAAAYRTLADKIAEEAGV